MKVGKPKSKRTPVRLRQKIQKASAAKERKRRKDAKKNPEWRSRLKKDPGVPNLFPYKAAVLAEIEENKRRKEEEAQRRRDLAKAQRQGKAVDALERSSGSGRLEDEEIASPVEMDEVVDDESMDEDDDSNPMAALLASAQARADTYAQASDDDSEEDEEGGNDEWNGIEDSNPTKPPFQQLQPKSLPKQALSDPIKTVTKLLDRIRTSSGGIQLLLDHYQIPPLVTAGSDTTTRFLVEVARKRGRLGRGGVPNLHSAALTVLGDVHEERISLPKFEKKMDVRTEKGEVRIVERMAEPFKIEGLWGEDGEGGSMEVEEDGAGGSVI